MAYNAKRDFITIDGTDFTNAFDGDDAFSYERNGDTLEFRKDSGGSDIVFELTDDSVNGSISIRPDAGTLLKKLRQLMSAKKMFSMTRDNRNPGGEKVDFIKCYIINEGANGKNSSGNKNARTFNFRAEKISAKEGEY